ncbi:hypothetical protein HID58_090819 [Brassica napus]|uniref:Uncharacterized protein n=1 Tax=Brassica napus TaxID=3708 RepID=A0ABQ7X8Z3_BRANA|nr:hypothetical protein HID58_090819 [Brassica napus]
MWLYGSIWDASSWATENGKYKADYKYQPFTAKYTILKRLVAPPTHPHGAIHCRLHHTVLAD